MSATFILFYSGFLKQNRKVIWVMMSDIQPVWPHTFVSPSADLRGAVASYSRKYVHEVLVNSLEGLSLPWKSVVRLTDRPDMALDVYCGSKCRRWWNVGESILPEGGSGETKLPQHAVELIVLLDFPDSQGPATHCKYIK